MILIEFSSFCHSKSSLFLNFANKGFTFATLAFLHLEVFYRISPRVSLFPPPATRDSWHLLLVPEGAGSVQVSEVRGAQWSMGDHSSLEQTDTQGSLTLGKWQNTIVQPEKGTKSYEL